MQTIEQTRAQRIIAPQGQCPVCGSAAVITLLEIDQVPVLCNVLWPTRTAALNAPKGDIQLGFCQDCGHLFNRAFNAALMEYAQDYENSLHFSPRFQSYAEALAMRLIQRYGLRGKDIIEIGCGKGDFLRLMCVLGGNRGVGFDPSYESKLGVENDTITIIQDFYSTQYTDYAADAVICRHVLEHIEFPRRFLLNVRESIGDRLEAMVYFEVPNATYTLRDMGIWDLIYEHYSYFSTSSLSRLFTACGFGVRDLAEAFQGQFLGIEAKPLKRMSRSASKSDLQELSRHAAAFAERYHSKVEHWRQTLRELAGQHVVIWGGGSKGVTFLNILQTQGQIAYAVDINPRKQGKYIAGTGQQLVAPEFLSRYQPDIVLIMNPVYELEIQQILASLGLAPELMIV